MKEEVPRGISCVGGRDGRMNKKYSYRILGSVSVCVLAVLACGLKIDLGQSPAPTQAPFQLPTGIPPATAVILPTQSPEPPPIVLNTAAPQPTVEINAVTEAPNDVTAAVQDYYQKGYLPFQNGQLYELDDFSRTTPSLNVFEFKRTGQEAQDFALWADIELDSRGATTYPNYTGCGFAYRVQSNSGGYTAILTNNAVRMGYCKSGMYPCELFGTTHGTGEVDVSNKTKTKFSLVVNKDVAYALVDDMLVGQYTLFTTKLLGMGEIYYGVVSNINADYWTSCQISNVRVWESNP